MGNFTSLQTPPETGSQTLTNLIAGVTADEAQSLSLTPGTTTLIPPNAAAPVNGGIVAGATDQTMVGGRFLFSVLAVPAAPIITQNGTAGVTSYAYTVEALLGNGNSGASAASTTFTTGNATLTATNSLNVTFTPVAGATSYNVRRTTGGATQGIIGNVLATGKATYTLVDTGLSADGSVTPNLNTTGLMAGVVQPASQVISAGTGAITIPSGNVVLTAGSAGAYTLQLPISGAPSAGGTNGCELRITTTTTNQHTVTTGSNGFNGTNSVFTFAATARTSLLIVGNGTQWTVLSLGGGALSA
jgi:hypothetical protein